MSTCDDKIQSIVEGWQKNNEGFCKDQEKLKNKLKEWTRSADENETGILLRLFENSHYFSKRKVNNIFLNFYKTLKNKEYSIFTAIESQEIRHNSSHVYLNEFALVSEVSEYSIIPVFSVLQASILNYIKQIVFIDDIIGSGKTVIDYFEIIKDRLKNKKVYIWVVCITEIAKVEVEKYANKNSLSITIRAERIEKKAFEKGYIFDLDEAEQNELIIKNLEKKLWNGQQSEYVLGKNDSQCLLSFYNDTPNNTLSSFWVCNQSWKPIFYRKKKKKPEWFKEKKRDRMKKNYERKLQK